MGAEIIKESRQQIEKFQDGLYQMLTNHGPQAEIRPITSSHK